MATEATEQLLLIHKTEQHIVNVKFYIKELIHMLDNE